MENYRDKTTQPEAEKVNRFKQWDDQVFGDPAIIQSRIWRQIEARTSGTRSSRVRLHRSVVFIRAAAATLVICALLFLFKTIPGRKKESAELSIATRAGEIKKIYLPDGSLVWLNSDSKMQYCQDMNFREVHLSGEAFFDVRHLVNKPFRIKTRHLVTQVLGTSFNLKSYDHEMTVLTVASGKVGLIPEKSASSDAVHFLMAKQFAAYNPNSRKVENRGRTDVSMNAGWRDGSLVFENTALQQVARDLERRYGVAVGVDSSIAGRTLYGTFRNKRLIEILKMISLSQNLNCTETSRGFKLKLKTMKTKKS